MYKVDEKKKKEIRYIANKLQPTYYDANSYVCESGKIMIEKGITIFNGQKVDPNKSYITGYRILPFMVNHSRRLLKAYQAEGNDGVVKYLKGYNEIMRPHEINLGSQL